MHRTGGSGHVEADQLERPAQDPSVERRVMGDQHPAVQPRGQRGQHLFEPGGVGQHLLSDPGEPLDAASERAIAAHERRPPVVQLATTDEHRAHLGQLAGVAAEAVGLRVDDEELRSSGRLFEQRHRTRDTPGPGRQATRIAERLDVFVRPMIGAGSMEAKSFLAGAVRRRGRPREQVMEGFDACVDVDEGRAQRR